MDKELKEKIYSKLYDSVGYLMTNHSDLPKSIGKVKLRLNKKGFHSTLQNEYLITQWEKL